MKLENVEITFEDLRTARGSRFYMSVKFERVTDDEIHYRKTTHRTTDVYVARKGQTFEGKDLYDELKKLHDGLEFLERWHTH